jgi:hypothetical protein
MVHASKIPESSSLDDQILDWFRKIEHRLDLIYRYKKHLDQSPKITPEQQNFVNGFMRPAKMVAFVLRYELAIREAIEIADATAEVTRLRALMPHVSSLPFDRPVVAKSRSQFP